MEPQGYNTASEGQGPRNTGVLSSITGLGKPAPLRDVDIRNSPSCGPGRKRLPSSPLPGRWRGTKCAGPQVTQAWLPGSRDRTTFSKQDRRRGEKKKNKTKKTPPQHARIRERKHTDGKGKNRKKTGRAQGPGDPRQIKEEGGGREGKHGGSAAAGIGGPQPGDRGRRRLPGAGPGPLAHLAARPKAAASRPAPPKEALPPRLPARPPVRTPPPAPLTRPARPTLPMSRGGAPGPRRRGEGGLGALSVSPRPQDPNRRQPLRRVRRARGGAGSGNACGRKRGTLAPAPLAALPLRPLPAGGPHRTSPPPASFSPAMRGRSGPSL